MRTIRLNGQPQPLIPIRTFRDEYHLSASFGVALFEPKDYTGLAALDHAGADLQRLRACILQIIPHRLPLLDLLTLNDTLQDAFDSELRSINPRIGLREADIEFAVAGFGDVCRAWSYALIRARGVKPDFASVYGEWLDNSVRLSSQEHAYICQDETWVIRILNAIYGRIGLEIRMQDRTVYVADSVYTCPAEGFMAALLQEVAERLQTI